MRIALMATGAIGGYLGTRLAAKGHEICAIARGAHLEAIRRDGLKLESPLGDAVLRPAIATPDPKEVGPVDAVIFAVKLWDTEEAAGLCRPMLGPDTIVIPFQNGVESADMIGAVIGKERIVPGVALISATIAAPGHIRQNGEFANFLMGPLPGGPTPDTLVSFVEACNEASVTASLVDDIETRLWSKLVFFGAFSGVTAAARCTSGDIQKTESIRRVFIAAMREAEAVARARGVALDPAIADNTLKFVDGMPSHIRATMANDLADGNRIEAHWLSGAVSRLGREAGVPTPVHDTLFACVTRFLEGAPD